MSKSTAVAERQETAPTETTGMVEMIERLARSPDVDVGKLEKLLEMQERIMDRQAKAAFMAALAEMKPKLPVIEKRGRIIIRDKNNQQVIKQTTPYSLWEDIDEAITPILHDHGFVLSFRTDATDDGRIIVTAVLSGHGHEERTTLPPLPFDTTGSKNNVQAVGSSLSYGKRYSATMLLNIRTKGEDDDGDAGGATPITAEQAATLKKKMVEAGADMDKFFDHFGIESRKMEDLPASQYDKAYRMLTQKAAIKSAKEQNSGGPTEELPL